MLPCGHTVCKNCYDFKLKQPQENKIKCPFQDNDEDHESIMDIPIKAKQNISFVKLLK